MSTPDMKSIVCRDHSGRFKLPVRRGRYPRACSEQNPCDKAKTKRAGKSERETGAPVSRSEKSGWCRCTAMGSAAHNRGVEGCRYHKPDPTRTEKSLPEFQAYYPAKLKNGQFVIIHAAGCAHTAKWPAAGKSPIVKLDLLSDDATAENLRVLAGPYTDKTWNGVGVSNCALNHAKRHRAGAQKAAEKPSALTKADNPCIPLAHTAKADLEPLGWAVRGRAGEEDGGVLYAEITATRGTELLVIKWTKLPTSPVIRTQQDYTLWNTDKPTENRKPRDVAGTKAVRSTDTEDAPAESVKGGAPTAKLPFNPALVEDRDLIREISGRKVTWFNRLGSNRETGIVGTGVNGIKIEHEYNANGDSIPSERIIKFVDASGHGFRAFRLSQLITIS